LFITHEEIGYMQESRFLRFRLADVKMVLDRSFRGVDENLEFFLASGRSYLFGFPENGRPAVRERLAQIAGGLPKLQAALRPRNVVEMTEKWRNQEMSNYEYLIHINLLSGRTFNDIAQYPIFPWVISNYRAEALDLKDETNYRDLSVPISDFPDPLPFLGRICPSLEARLAECPQVASIGELFDGIAQSASSFELIPELFTLPECLLNVNKIAFLGDVGLPPWARGSAHRFVEMNRQALESNYVSSHLPEWIDLVCGRNQHSVVSEEVARLKRIGTGPRQVFPVEHPHKHRPGPVFSFNREGLVALFPVESPIQWTFEMAGQVYLLQANWSLITFALLDRLRSVSPARNGSIAEFVPTSCRKASQPSDSFAIVPGTNRFAVSSMCDSLFHLFDVIRRDVAHGGTFRQTTSVVKSLHSAGKRRLLTCGKDSSLTLWKLEKKSNDCIPVYRIQRPQFVAIDVNSTLNLVATVDQRRMCVLSLLKTGELVREFAIDGADPVTRVVLLTSAFVAVFSTSVIRLYGIDGVLVGSCEIQGQVSAVERVEFGFGRNALAIGCTDGRFLTLGVPDLDNLLTETCDGEITSILFAREKNTFVIATRTRVFGLSVT
jgi:hypothetical protein